MTIKRIIMMLTIVAVTYLLVVTGKQRLLGHYRQKANVALFLSGNYKKSIYYYDKLIYLRPDAAGYYYSRGDAYDEDGQYEKAISDYKNSLQLGIEDSLQAVLRIALVAKRQGNLQMQEEYLQRLLRLSKDNKEKESEFWAANYHLGQLEFNRKNYRKAVKYYNTAHLFSQQNFELYHRANSYFSLGKIDSARQDLKKSIYFVKMEFIRKNPNSILAKCDTCSFPFGTREYQLLTERDGETIIQTLDKFADDKQIQELNDKLKLTEKNSR